MNEKFDCRICGEVDFVEDDTLDYGNNKIDFNENVYCVDCFDDFEPQQRVLVKYLDCGLEKIEEHYGIWKYGKEEYLVLTDEEADEKWDEILDSYIDECLEIPDNMRQYFNEEKWKDDAKMDGRGNAIANYDGNERRERDEDTGEVYYIYRIN